MDQNLWNAVDRYLSDKLISPTNVSRMHSKRTPAPDFRPSTSLPIRASYFICSPVSRERVAFSRSARSAATPPSGSLAHFRPPGNSSPLSCSRNTRLLLNPTSSAPASPRWSDIRVGPALDSLTKLHAEKPAPFDFIFIDADKENNPHYLDWAVKPSRPGTLIITDNIVRDGAIIEDANEDPRVIGTRTFLEKLGKDPRLDATAIQTVGVKGYDGTRRCHRQTLTTNRLSNCSFISTAAERPFSLSISSWTL